VSLGGADASTLDALREGLQQHRQVEIDYYSYSTDENRRRRIDPYRVYATEGNWYVIGWCHHAEAERLFRVDRIRSAELLDDRFELPEELPEPTTYAGSGHDRHIALDVDPRAQWIATYYPVDSVEARDDGKLRVVLAVGGDAWLERLLVRLGPDARVVDLDPAPGGHPMVGSAEARRMIEDVTSRVTALY
jgi:proteasome accessory factor C